MTRATARRAVLIGLDGATFSILDSLTEDGVMPFLRGLVARGVRGVLLSTPHPLTPPAWTSLMTGRSPGHHGVFDFVRVERGPGHPRYVLGTSADVRCETIWSMASRQGCRVTALNFPSMFPPPPINGFVVPGFVPWQYLPRAVQPRDLYARLKARREFNAREVAMDWDVERKALQGLPADQFEPWIRFHITRERQWFEITRFLMQEEPCDLTAILFDGVDKLQHLCFHLLDPRSAEQETSPWATRIRVLCFEYFRQLDGFLERIVAMAGPEARVFLASDHGFTAAGNRIFYANVWLQQHGYLQWADGVALDEGGRLTLEGHAGADTLFDWGWDATSTTPRTTAFALTASSNGIFIRTAERPGDAGVPAAEYRAFRRRLIEALLAFVDPATGERVVEQVVTREEAFPGPEMPHAPDLTLVLRDRSFLSVLRADVPLKERRSPYGTHHPHGMFVASGPGIRSGVEIAPCRIVDIAPTVLYSLGLPLASDLEGRPALEAFEPSYVVRHPVCLGTPTLSLGSVHGTSEAPSLGAAEEAQVLDRLKALGYLE